VSGGDANDDPDQTSIIDGNAGCSVNNDNSFPSSEDVLTDIIDLENNKLPSVEQPKSYPFNVMVVGMM
jgi:hypothetical protein